MERRAITPPCGLPGRPAALLAPAGQVAAVAGQDRQEGVQGPGGGPGQLAGEETGGKGAGRGLDRRKYFLFLKMNQET